MREYTTISQAARLLGLSESMVRVLVERGRLPIAAVAGNRRLFERTEVQALAERHNQQRRQSCGLELDPDPAP